MGKAKRRAQLRQAEKELARRKTFTQIVFVFAVLVAVASGVGIAFAQQKPTAPAAFIQPTTFSELVAVKPEDLPKVDLARMNLLCASGLPGAEQMDIEACLAERDRYAAIAKEQIEKYLPMYQRALPALTISKGSTACRCW